MSVSVFVLVLCGLFATVAQAQGKQPTVEMTSILGAGLDQSGGLTFTTFDLIFGPEGGANVDIIIKTADGKEVKSYKTRPEYQATKEAYSRLMVDGALYVKLDAGDYLLDFVVEGTLATRFPFKVVEESDDGDDFTTSNKKQFIGPWQKLAYLHYTRAHNFDLDSATGTSEDKTLYHLVNLRMWGSQKDLTPGSSGENLIAKLTRDGELIGHSKLPTGYLSTNKPINRVDMVIFQPHSKQEEANVLGLSEAELLTGDHSYHLTVQRQSDGVTIRDFTFKSQNGKLVPLPRTELSYTPHYDYIAPRAVVFGSQNYEFEPVYWLEMK